MNYLKIYNDLISSRQKFTRSKREAVYESHHIVPKSLGGTNDFENLILLTPREHYLAHWLLFKIHTGKNKAKMAYAFFQMARGGRSKYASVTSKQFERAKQTISESTRGENHPRYGKSKPHSEEHKLKISNSMKGISFTEEHRINLSKSAKGKSKRVPLSTISKLNACSAARKGVPQNTIICPHCNKQGGFSAMNRWHFDNCKLKTGAS